jgi:hypothetical protein
VCLTHVGTGQGILVFTPGGDLFGPVHHAGTQHRYVFAQVVEAQFGNPADLTQCFTHFILRLMAQTTGEGGDDLLPRQAFTGCTLDRKNEGETEFGVVIGIELLQ